MTISDAAGVLGALGVCSTAVLALLTYRKASAVHAEVKMRNGDTLGKVADAAERRRHEADEAAP